MAFVDTWNCIQTNIPRGTAISNWTAANGSLGDSFTVTAVAPAHVQVDTPGARSVQSIPKDHFEIVYGAWGTYSSGSLPRHKVRDMTRFSKYIISIFHWIESQNGGQLP